MNETGVSSYTKEYKAESDSDICISELSPSAIRGAVKFFDLVDEVAFDSVFN